MARLPRSVLALASFCVAACRSTAAPAPTPSAGDIDPADAAVAQPHVLSADPSVLSQSLESEAQVGPSLAMTQDGRLAVAWMSAPGDREHASAIGVRFSSDGGSTWSAVQAVKSPGDRTATDPAVAADRSGNIYLAWRANGPDGPGGVADSHVYVARADAPGIAFGPPVDLADRMHRGARLFKPWLVATAEGAIVATWGYASSLGDGIGVARSVDGHAWGKDVLIERIGLKAALPRACASTHGDRVWVVYLDAEAGVRLRASDDGGTTWSPARTATVSSAEDRPKIGTDTPVCAGNGDEVTVVYGLARDSKSRALGTLVVAKSYDGGRVFDARRTLEAGASELMHPELVREDDGTLDLAYYAAGRTPETGALRWVRAAGDRSPLTDSKVARANFRFEPAADQRFWPGDSFGWGWRAGTLYAASTDNSGDMPHVAFTRIPSR